MVARIFTRRDHQLEVLRIAALMAHVVGGVGESERRVLEQLARLFDLDAGIADDMILEAASIREV